MNYYRRIKPQTQSLESQAKLMKTQLILENKNIHIKTKFVGQTISQLLNNVE